MGLTLTWWQTLLFWPGIRFMDWLARTWPEVVIRYDIGFTMDSYLYWSMLISVIFWTGLFIGVLAFLRYFLTPSRSNE